jgi:hypothetical protein
MKERYHATTQNRFYPDMSNVNKTITVEAKFISPPMYILKEMNISVSLRFGDRKSLAGPSSVDMMMMMMMMIVILATTKTVNGLRFPFCCPGYKFQSRVQLC